MQVSLCVYCLYRKSEHMWYCHRTITIVMSGISHDPITPRRPAPARAGPRFALIAVPVARRRAHHREHCQLGVRRSTGHRHTAAARPLAEEYAVASRRAERVAFSASFAQPTFGPPPLPWPGARQPASSEPTVRSGALAPGRAGERDGARPRRRPRGRRRRGSGTK